MIGRVLVLAGGLAGAVGLSQFPEFSQQYLQRLAGQVDALTEVVEDFDASAQKSGLTREEALAELKGTTFLERRREDLTRTFVRFDQLTADLALLRATGPLERLIMPHRMADRSTLAAAWADFKPAVPVTLDGFIAAAIGFVAGSVLLRLIFGLLLWPFRRNRPSEV